MKLPAIFEERMEELLGMEYPAFREKMDGEPFYGLRVNTLKISVERFLELAPFQLRPIPWVPEGFYYNEAERPGKHPFFHAGLYYIQEPSAMSPVALLDPQPGETVLDTCAAPGGKTCQIGGRMMNRGLIFTNDISATRAKALLHNLELSGIRNAILLCEDPKKFAPRLSGKVDRILVDAPCSGEGMFRKLESTVKLWNPDLQDEYYAMQKPILEAAAQMLAPGGHMVYSTCTYNRRENEDAVFAFLKEHPEFSQDPGVLSIASPGIPGNDGEPAIGMYRLWPHKVDGEGHFAARLKRGESEAGDGTDRQVKSAAPPEFLDFIQQYLPNWKGEGIYKQIEERLLLVPRHNFNLSGIRILREGWYLGDVQKGRFEPSQALAMGLEASDFTQTMDFGPDDPDVIRYIKGETLHVDAPKGWVLVTVSGFPLGWAKGVSGFLKNHYPASWRRQD